MIQQKSNYYYDSSNDICSIYLKKANHVYSEEESKGIFIIYDENTDEIIGAEILYYSNRLKVNLQNKLPKQVMDIVNNLKI